MYPARKKKSRCFLKDSKKYNLGTRLSTINRQQNPLSEEVEVVVEFAYKVVVEAMWQVKASLTILEFEDVVVGDEDSSKVVDTTLT